MGARHHFIRLLLPALSTLAACSPALNWREFRPAETPLSVSMPCRPSSGARQVVLAGHALPMTLYACRVDELTFALGVLDARDPALVGAVLVAMAQAAVANVQGRILEDAPAAVTGMTPHPAARRLGVDGRAPDGRALRLHTAVFSVGTRVFQATVIGGEIDSSVDRHFFDALKVVR